MGEQLSEANRALIEREVGLSRVETVGGCISLTDPARLEKLMNAARSEGPHLASDKGEEARKAAFASVPVEPEALRTSIEELDAWNEAGLPLDEIKDWGSFGEAVSLCLHELKRLISRPVPGVSRETIEKLIAWSQDDHKRGCQGREYACTCGHDERGEGLLALLSRGEG